MTHMLHPPPEPAAEGLRVAIDMPAADDDGAVLCAGSFDTPFGRVVALGARSALWGLGFVGAVTEAEVRADLAARFPRASLVDAPEALAPAIAALIAGRGDLRVRLKGTPFQMKVWQALLSVPPGQVISYAMLARMIGQPGASRATGTAVGQNPVSWAVPCHRVTRKDGAIGGYHWGEAVKRMLLAREGAIVAPLSLSRL